MQSDETEFDALKRALSRRDDLPADEAALLDRLPRRLHVYGRGDEIVPPGSRPQESCLMLSGYSARAVFLEDGGRQLTAIHVAGDFVDLHALLLKTVDHGVVALAPCRVAFVAHEYLIEITQKAPHLTRLLWLSTVIDASITGEWIAGLGRRSAIANLAHLLCEIYVRLTIVDLASDCRFAFPVTQSNLADMLGMSLVHLGRTLGLLRRTGLIVWDDGMVTITDFDALAEFCNFDTGYLNLIKEPR